MLESLQRLLQELGVLMLQWRSAGQTQGQWQGTQLKAWADQQAHAFLLRGLQEMTPGLPVISEEGDTLQMGERPQTYWLVDPIDGTASFCGGFDGFVTQVALMQGAQPVLGVVYAPALGLCYSAQANGPALCNGRMLTCNAVGNAAPRLIDNYPEPRGLARDIYDQLPCAGYVESGSLGLKICRVADGSADLFVKDVVVRDWDLAPAHVVLARAGGVLTAWDGSALPYGGSFERQGLLAATDAALAARVGQWRQRRDNTPHEILPATSQKG